MISLSRKTCLLYEKKERRYETMACRSLGGVFPRTCQADERRRDRRAVCARASGLAGASSDETGQLAAGADDGYAQAAQNAAAD